MGTSTQVIGSEEILATPGNAAKLIWEMRAKNHSPISISGVAEICYCCGIFENSKSVDNISISAKIEVIPGVSKWHNSAILLLTQMGDFDTFVS